MRPRARRRMSPSSTEPQRSQRSVSGSVRSSPAREPQAARVVAVDDGEAAGEDEVELEQVDRRRRVELDHRHDLVALERPVAVEREPRPHLAAAPRAAARRRRSARTAPRRRRARPGGARARRSGRAPRGRGTTRAGARRTASRVAGATSSAGGVGTSSSVSRTTSSPRAPLHPQLGLQQEAVGERGDRDRP